MDLDGNFVDETEFAGFLPMIMEAGSCYQSKLEWRLKIKGQPRTLRAYAMFGAVLLDTKEVLGSICLNFPYRNHVLLS